MSPPQAQVPLPPTESQEPVTEKVQNLENQPVVKEKVVEKVVTDKKPEPARPVSSKFATFVIKLLKDVPTGASGVITRSHDAGNIGYLCPQFSLDPSKDVGTVAWATVNDDLVMTMISMDDATSINYVHLSSMGPPPLVSYTYGASLSVDMSKYGKMSYLKAGTCINVTVGMK